jgi:hypothetical protein
MIVRILAHDFEVVEVEEGHPQLENSWGSFNHDEQVIYIQEGLAPTVAKETLFHEILHGVDNMVVSDGLDERDIFRLSVVMYATLLDNPRILSYLFDDEGG